MGNCLECNSMEMISGKLSTASRAVTPGFLCFNPGNLKWYKSLFTHGVRVAPKAHCCAACGLTWTGVDTEKLRTFIRNSCLAEFRERVLSSEYGDGRLASTACSNCGAKKKIVGSLKSNTDGNRMSFIPDHVYQLEFKSFKRTAECCAACGYVFIHLDPARLCGFILQNYDTKYAMRVYSYQDQVRGPEAL